MGALQGLAVRLGSLREGRKSIIFVSEGFTAMLPPQMRRMDASAPANPIETARGGRRVQDSTREITNEWFGQMDVYSRLRDVYDVANRNNTAVYSLDPRGLAAFEYGIDDISGAPPSFATDRRALQMTQDTLRVLSEETDGRAIVNRNTLEAGTRARWFATRASTTCSATRRSRRGADGKFHQITVRVKRRGVDVRARKGYWALTAADVEQDQESDAGSRQAGADGAGVDCDVGAVRQVRAHVDRHRARRERQDARDAHLGAAAAAPGARRDHSRAACRCLPPTTAVISCSAAARLTRRWRRRPPRRPTTPECDRPLAGRAVATAPQRLVFDSPPGKIELRMTVEAAGVGGTLDSEIRKITVPDFTAPQVAHQHAARLSRAHRARIPDDGGGCRRRSRCRAASSRARSGC